VNIGLNSSFSDIYIATLMTNLQKKKKGLIVTAYVNNLGVLQTMAVNQEDKGFQQIDWLKANACLLDIYTIGQRPKANAL
jgi:hypothetical protein